MKKEEAKAILRSNLKGSKKKTSPLLIIAQAVRLLASDPEYGSTTKLADSFGVKRPTIEAFEKMNDQPAKIQKLIEEGKIGIDTNTKLASVVEIKRRIAVANAIASLKAKDAREIITKCKNDRTLEPEECKKAIVNAKSVGIQKKTLTIPLEPAEHSKFLEMSKNVGLSPKEASKQAISEWMKGHERTADGS